MLPYVHGALFRTAQALPGRSIARCVELLELQLLRSKDAPLSIIFDHRPKNDFAQPFLCVILPFFHRCAYIQAPIHILSQLPFAGKLEQLTEVVVYLVELATSYSMSPAYHNSLNEECLQNERLALQHLSAQPNLRSFAAHCQLPKFSHDRGLDCLGPSPTLFSQARLITKLVLVDVDRSRGWWWYLSEASTNLGEMLYPRKHLAGHLLYRLLNLSQLQFHDNHDHEESWASCFDDLPEDVSSSLTEDTSPAPRVSLPKLLTLVITGCRTIASNILEGIMAPELHTLDYTGPLIPGITEFLAISGCQLGTLRLYTNLNNRPVERFFRSDSSSTSWTLKVHTLQIAHHAGIASAAAYKQRTDPWLANAEENAPPVPDASNDGRTSLDSEAKIAADVDEDEDVLGTVRGNAILGLLTRSTVAGSTDTALPAVDLFPSLQYITLASLCHSLNAVFTMLESRFRTQRTHGNASNGRTHCSASDVVQQSLRGCTLSRLLSPMLRFIPAEERALNEDQIHSRVLLSNQQHSAWPSNRLK